MYKSAILVYVGISLFAGTTSICEDDWRVAETRISSLMSELDEERIAILLRKYIDPNLLTNVPFLADMARQTEYPFLSIGALSILKEQQLEVAYKIALDRCWRSTNVGDYFLTSHLALLTNVIRVSAFNESLSWISFSEPFLPENGPIVVGQLPITRLAQFYQSESWKSASATLHALVLERLFRSSDARAVALRNVIRKDIQELKYVPGIPLLVYLLCGDVDLAQINRMISIVLQEKRISSVGKQAVIRKYAGNLKDFDLGSLVITNREKEAYRKLIEKYSH